ncbi:MAG: UDP-N-acetylglucosamine--N-acetylmuramyl-(pentapeptide) pyrophosphoryl-undecaprenol N-acetylglucosamine transferase [Fuerstiella sp.]|nr:UDP-N-acetylglucosamine--N-acetylmuramyl-(pentapeptide) pyrophosphoryl-undecaprenol N-acetylglucosamine transferase [Fuerstiella sp.]MCP4857817.1 UDP-N-acetylglucosamine--N-acetylmuramyl-(pentapeptide) pyrophosphoryl-undecaprenol N-acetylglucosamine transferase [Fuerstiella sp.]
MSQLQHIAFCGGGSGGHLIPAIAVAEELRVVNSNTHFLFLTSGRPIDRHILENSGLPTGSVDQVALPLRTSTGRILFAFQCVRSVLQCRRRFQRQRPDIVIGLGGFAAIPGVAAAWVSGIPVVLLEQNTVPGRANRWLRRLATTTYVGWPLETKWRHQWRSPIIEVGVPLRRVFPTGELSCAPPVTAVPNTSRLLVLGGSQGAMRLNSIVVNTLTSLNSRSWKLHVVHQTGIDDLDNVRNAYEQAGITADVHAFIDDMPQQLTASTLVISRSGAVALAEIAASGKASVLFPLSTSCDNHQLRNAEFLEACGAAVIVCEQDHDAPLRLADHLRRLLDSDCRQTNSNQEPVDCRTEIENCTQAAETANAPRAAMESAARRVAPENAAAAIVKSLLTLSDRSVHSPE